MSCLRDPLHYASGPVYVPPELPAIYAALRLLPGARGRLLRYGQWPDPNGTVTFAALALYGEKP